MFQALKDTFLWGFCYEAKEAACMPRKPRRPCRYPGCNKLAEDGEQYCPEHKKLVDKQYDHFTRGYNGNKRYGSQWRKIRSRYVHKHPLCEECLKHGKCVPVEEVHHIIPISEGGTNDESNLMSLCRSCHEKIHDKHVVQ